MTPKIRFKGFTDPWEQRKLGDFGNGIGGTPLESYFNNNGKYKIISIGSYTENNSYRDQNIRVDKNEKSSERILNKNDLTMVLNDKTTAGNIIGRVLLINKNNTFVYNQRTERIVVNKQYYYPLFLYHFLNSDRIREKIIKVSQGNTQIYVNWKSVSNIQYIVPKFQEQNRIAKLLDKSQSIIAANERRIDELKNLKKYLMQNMFI